MNEEEVREGKAKTKAKEVPFMAPLAKDGQVTVPKWIRKGLRLEPGDLLELRFIGRVDLSEAGEAEHPDG